MKYKSILLSVLVCGFVMTSLDIVQAHSKQCTLLYNHIKTLKNGPISAFPHELTLGGFKYTLSRDSYEDLTPLQRRDVTIDGKASVSHEYSSGEGTQGHWYSCGLSVPTNDKATKYVFSAHFLVDEID